MPPRPWLALSASLIPLFSLVACGGDDGNSGNTPSTSGTTGPAASATVQQPRDTRSEGRVELQLAGIHQEVEDRLQIDPPERAHGRANIRRTANGNEANPCSSFPRCATPQRPGGEGSQDLYVTTR